MSNGGDKGKQIEETEETNKAMNRRIDSTSNRTI